MPQQSKRSIAENYKFNLLDQAEESCHKQWGNLSEYGPKTPKKTLDRSYGQFTKNLTFLSIEEPDTARNMLQAMAVENIQHIREPYGSQLASYLQRVRSNLKMPT